MTCCLTLVKIDVRQVVRKRFAKECSCFRMHASRPANAELDLRTLLQDLVSSLRCLAAVQNDQSKLCAVLVYEGHEMIRGQELQTIGKEAIIANKRGTFVHLASYGHTRVY